MLRRDQNRKSSMDKVQEYELLQDLLDISKDTEFGSQFEVKLVDKNRSDRLVIKIPSENNQFVKIIVTFQEYPTMRIPQIETRGDELSNLVAQATSPLIMPYKGKLIRIRNIIEVIQQATDIVINQKKILSVNTRENLEEKNTTIHESPSSAQSNNHPVKNAIQQPLSSRKTRVERVVKPESKVLPDSRQMIQHNSEDYELAITVEKLFVIEILIDSILRDFSKHSPNEYAFICSGVFTQEGTAFITDYYPGQMQISTPVYCELKEAFIEDVVYNKIPKSHNVIVWGHVHPIEGPSGTDIGSFHDLAEWDREVTKKRILSKRSIAMLINAHDHRISFYDVHSPSKMRLSHSVIASGGGKSYDY